MFDIRSICLPSAATVVIDDGDVVVLPPCVRVTYARGEAPLLGKIIAYLCILIFYFGANLATMIK